MPRRKNWDEIVIDPVTARLIAAEVQKNDLPAQSVVPLLGVQIGEQISLRSKPQDPNTITATGRTISGEGSLTSDDAHALEAFARQVEEQTGGDIVAIGVLHSMGEIQNRSSLLQRPLNDVEVFDLSPQDMPIIRELRRQHPKAKYLATATATPQGPRLMLGEIEPLFTSGGTTTMVVSLENPWGHPIEMKIPRIPSK